MGTPNSVIAKKALEEYLLYGATPGIDVWCALGLDIKFLKDRREEIKPQLPYLQGYVNLEDACSYVRETKSWKVLVEEAGLAGTKVIRFALKPKWSKYAQPILSLDPVGSGSTVVVEIFLTRNGDWIVWDGGDYPGRLSRFSRHRTDTTAVRRLREIEGTEHVYLPFCYVGFRYWPPVGSRKHNRHGEECAIALVLAKHIRTILEASIAAKQDRLQTQATLREEFVKADERGGLTT